MRYYRTRLSISWLSGEVTRDSGGDEPGDRFSVPDLGERSVSEELL